jgi:hypothetical protein
MIDSVDAGGVSGGTAASVGAAAGGSKAANVSADVICGGVVGGDKQPSSCGICLFLANTAARLLARVASLYIFARFHGGGAGCGDRTSSDGAGCNGDGVFCCDKAVCGDRAGCNDEAV